MNIIEKFLRKVSYKFPKGYPDINDKQDMILLENILKDLLEIDYNILDFGDLERFERSFADFFHIGRRSVNFVPG